MCLITFQIGKHPTYKFVLAANRDEQYQRPTRTAGFWSEFPFLLAGKDLLADGTWLGITKKGKIAAITNCHDLENATSSQFYTGSVDKLSRGKIVTDYLTSDSEPIVYLEKLFQQKNSYQPFNLLCGTVDHLYHFNSREQTYTSLQEGIYGLSNASLDTPWPKVVHAKKQLDEILQQPHFDKSELFRMMMDQTPAPDEQLPSSPIPLELKRKTSANYIATESFGTRSTTLLLVDHNDVITFIERSYSPDQQYTDLEYQFQIE